MYHAVTPGRPSCPSLPANIILMGAARLDDPIKGLDYAIDALNIIVARAHPEVAAGVRSRVLRGDTQPATARTPGIPYRHLGMITDSRLVSDLYAASRIILSTSLYETLPGTLIEGMAGGCIPVSFAQGGQSRHIHPPRHPATWRSTSRRKAWPRASCGH